MFQGDEMTTSKAPDGGPNSIHPHAICETSAIGPGSAVAAFTHIASTARLGADVTVGESVVINAGVTIGDRVTIGAGSWVGASAVIDDDVRIAQNVTLVSSSDGDASAGALPAPVIRAGASIEAGATIMAGTTVGRGAVVEAGAVVRWPVPPYSVVAGNPAWTRVYLGAEDLGRAAHALTSDATVVPLGVGASHVCRLDGFIDARGGLTVTDFASACVPFSPARFFMLYDAPSGAARGDHAHRECHQFLVCVSGSVWVSVDDGAQRKEFVLDSPDIGVYIPPLVWASQFRFLPNSVVLAMASHRYDPSDYIRDYEQFLAEIKS
jgi:UDP-2-acetamido-3-amino-2,3-dideoxy-glucuronate N-acetyltransferase